MSFNDSAQGRVMTDGLNKAADAGGIVSIVIGFATWVGAHVPALVQWATLILTVILIARNIRAYFRGDWDRGT